MLVKQKLQGIKKPTFILIFALALGGLLGRAAPVVGRNDQPGSDLPAIPQIILLGASPQQIDLKAILPAPNMEQIKAGGKVYTRISGDGYGVPEQVGLPDLPVYRQAVEIPFGASLTLNVGDTQYRDIVLTENGLQPVSPLQPPVPKLSFSQAKNRQENTPWFEDSGFYQKDLSYPPEPITLGEEYVVRGHRFQVVETWPAVYNPGAGRLRLYSAITFRIELSGSDMARTRSLSQRYASTEYDRLLARNALNWNQGNLDNTAASSDRPSYIIISADNFASALQPFISILAMRGFDVNLVRLSQIPGSEPRMAIKNYIQSVYDGSRPPAYVLLVGDTDTIPAWPSTQSIGSYTDLYYFTMDGPDDWHPDILHGRFPVRSEAEIEAVVQKYQKYYYLTGQEAWLKKATFISSCDPYYYSIPEATHNYVINTYAKPAGYSGLFPLVNNPGGDQIYCKTYNGTAAQINAAADEGRWAIVYSGHGSETGWSDGAVAFDQNAVRSLDGQDFFPFVASYACLTGSFGSPLHDESFGETWLLQPNKGALAFWGAAQDTFWNEDDTLERSMFDALFTDLPDKPRLADMTGYALSQVENTYPASARYYWEAYNLLGDPSVKVFREPERPVFTLNLKPDQSDVCKEGVVTTTVQVGSFNGYTGLVDLQYGPLPQNVSAQLPSFKGIAPYETQLSFGIEPGSIPGSYTIPITASDAEPLSESQDFGLHILDQPPGLPELVLPQPGGINVSQQPAFQWTPLDQTHQYRFQLADNPLFINPLIEKNSLIEASTSPGIGLKPDACYWWRAGGENACGSGVWSPPAHFSTFRMQQDFADDIENGPNLWSEEAVYKGVANWSISTIQAYSGTNAWFIPDPATVSDSRLWIAQPFAVLPGSRLTFWQRYHFEGPGYDGGILEISTDGGTSWTNLDKHITSSGYNGVIDTRFGNPLAGLPGWIGDQDAWTQVTVDLSPYSGNSAQVRWRIGSDTSIGDQGWFVDDVYVLSYAPELPMPLVSGVSSNTASAFEETPLTISGSGFYGVPAVKLGDTWLLSTTAVSTETITTVIPRCLASGTYTLSLTNGDCQETSLPDAVTILRDDHAAAAIEVSSPVFARQPVTFTAVVTGTQPASYHWDFGGGGYGTGLDSATPVFTYAHAGKYLVSLTVDGSVCPMQTKKWINVISYDIFLPLIKISSPP